MRSVSLMTAARYGRFIEEQVLILGSDSKLPRISSVSLFKVSEYRNIRQVAVANVTVVN